MVRLLFLQPSSTLTAWWRMADHGLAYSARTVLWFDCGLCGAAATAAAAAACVADLEEFDRMVEGKGKDSQDNRAVPPCYKVRSRRNRYCYVASWP
jgi:hypothetical protein